MVLFLLAAGWVCYVLFGYPLLLVALNRRTPPPHAKRFEPKTVTVLLAVHNGERWLRSKLESVLALDYPRELLRVLVISDGSTDHTVAIAEEFSGCGVDCIAVPKGGKALALNAGLACAGSDIIFFTDVRQPLERQSLRELVANFADPRVGVVSGELIIREGNSLSEVNVGLYWKYEKWIRVQLSRLDSGLGATGCIYAMRRDLTRPLPAGCLLDDVFLPLCAFFQGYRVLLDTSARAFDEPSKLESEFRRKVRTLAGVYQLIGYFPELLGPKNRMWVHFVSHKLGRLLVPWALIVVAVTAFWLPAPWSYGMVLGQICFYGLAVLDLVIAESSPFKRGTSPVRTFVVLMAASLMAASIVVRPAGNLWKSTR
jgi:cellulose synthase/poly-beta-1,6-N-acetylglucosamine synthase-like glycosyltransferase